MILQGLLGPIAAKFGPVLRASSASERLQVGGATLDVFVDSNEFELGNLVLLDWVVRSAGAMTAYFGRFTVARARMDIIISVHGRISNGVSFGDAGARCKISVGRVKPIARACVGLLSSEQVWGEMLLDMTQGLPQADNQGLDQKGNLRRQSHESVTLISPLWWMHLRRSGDSLGNTMFRGSK
jgi:hypothetical protein